MEQLELDPAESLIVSIDQDLRDTYRGVKEFLKLESQRRRWTCSPRKQQSIYDHQVDPDAANAFDARSLPNVIRVIGHTRFLDVLYGVEAEVRRDRATRRLDDRIGPQRANGGGAVRDAEWALRRARGR